MLGHIMSAYAIVVRVRQVQSMIRQVRPGLFSLCQFSSGYDR